MTDGDGARTEHPDELLAGYVGGSASSDERRTVEAHLAGCSQCRDDLALAMAARTALASLPQLDAPGLAAQGVEALRAGATRPPEEPAGKQTERVPVTAGVTAGASDELADRRGAFKENSTTAASPLAPSMAGTTPRLAGVSAPAVVRCAVHGAGLPAGTIPVYLEAATYQGTPAYVVAVLTEGGNRSHLRVYAVGRQDCSFLYEADQPL